MSSFTLTVTAPELASIAAALLWLKETDSEITGEYGIDEIATRGGSQDALTCEALEALARQLIARLERAEAATATAAPVRRITLHCPACGSEDVAVDGSLVWDAEAQAWQAGEPHDAMICLACGHEAADGFPTAIEAAA